MILEYLYIFRRSREAVHEDSVAREVDSAIGIALFQGNQVSKYRVGIMVDADSWNFQVMISIMEFYVQYAACFLRTSSQFDP